MCTVFALATTGTGKVFAEERYQELQLFAKVLNLVQQYYVEEVDTKKLIYGGIKGMLRELDPHTNFLPPEIYKEFETETTGEFGGIGIEITVQNSILTISSPIEDTPPWKAGLQAGDKLVEIDGELLCGDVAGLGSSLDLFETGLGELQSGFGFSECGLTEFFIVEDGDEGVGGNVVPFVHEEFFNARAVVSGGGKDLENGSGRLETTEGVNPEGARRRNR